MSVFKGQFYQLINDILYNGEEKLIKIYKELTRMSRYNIQSGFNIKNYLENNLKKNHTKKYESYLRHLNKYKQKDNYDNVGYIYVFDLGTKEEQNLIKIGFSKEWTSRVNSYQGTPRLVIKMAKYQEFEKVIHDLLNPFQFDRLKPGYKLDSCHKEFFIFPFNILMKMIEFSFPLSGFDLERPYQIILQNYETKPDLLEIRKFLVHNLNTLNFKNSYQSYNKNKDNFFKNYQLSDHKQNDLGKKQKGKINLNTATAVELMQIHGIGPVLSNRIVENRPYTCSEDVRKLKMFGPKRTQLIVDNCFVSS